MDRFVTAAYLATSAVAASAAWKSRARMGGKWWVLVGVGLLALGALRITEAALWADDYLRSGLFVTGWYNDRRAIQVACIAAFVLASFVTLRSLGAKTNRVPLALAIFAFFGLAVFGAVRSSSLHWSDAILGEQLGTVMLSHAIQLALLLVIFTAALLDCYASSKGPPAIAPRGAQ